jgi:hypothetical protein
MLSKGMSVDQTVSLAESFECIFFPLIDVS